MSNAIAKVTNGNGHTTGQSRTEQQASSRGQSFHYTPRFGIWDGEQEWLLYGDLPGVSAESIDLNFENGELTVHGRVEPRGSESEYLAREYGIADFHRVFWLGEEIDADNISAEMKNGVLLIRLPKSETVKPRRIEVKVG